MRHGEEHGVCPRCGVPVEPDGPDYDGAQVFVDGDGSWDCKS